MKKSFYFYTSIALLIILGLIIGNYIFGWTTPTANPPSSNLPAPINTGSSNQSKEGYLAVGTTTTPTFPLDVAGVLRVGSFSSSPTGTNGAIYYDTTDGKLKGYQAGSWSPLGGGSPSGSTGYIQFASSTQFGSDPQLFWDNTNKKLGVGTTTPASALDVTGNVIARTSTSTVTIKADGSISTNLNADKLDGYEASDLLAKSYGYINWNDCNVTAGCATHGYIVLECATTTGYVSVDSTCTALPDLKQATQGAYCYYTGPSTLTLSAPNRYERTCGSLKCCKYIPP